MKQWAIKCEVLAERHMLVETDDTADEAFVRANYSNPQQVRVLDAWHGADVHSQPVRIVSVEEEND